MIGFKEYLSLIEMRTQEYKKGLGFPKPFYKQQQTKKPQGDLPLSEGNYFAF